MSAMRGMGVELLGGFDFGDMNSALYARVASCSWTRDCLSRESIYFPDDPSETVYWVEEGRVKLSRVSGDGRELTLRHLRSGDMFGEECMAAYARRQDYAESMEPSRLRCMEARDFCELLSTEIGFTQAVMQHACRRAREVEQVFAETVFRPVSGRIAAGLLRLYNQGDSVDGTIRVTHQEVANLVGSTRETTTSVLHTFREAGVVEIANRRVTVLDPDALRELALHSQPGGVRTGAGPHSASRNDIQ